MPLSGGDLVFLLISTNFELFELSLSLYAIHPVYNLYQRNQPINHANRHFSRIRRDYPAAMHLCHSRAVPSIRYDLPQSARYG